MKNFFDLDSLVAQVSRNCDISDALYSGGYSVCGLALRLRDLYKWEMGLQPWMERESGEILDWIGQREERWDQLGEENFSQIEILGRSFDPFETGHINSILERSGFFYGAGYAHGVKPTFFLTLIEGEKEIDGHKVYVLGKELARDLFSTPALSQEDCIVIRQQSARSYLWEKIHYVSASGRPAVKFALECYGLHHGGLDKLPGLLEHMAAREAETYVYHELGEIRDSDFDRNIWREIIAEFPRTRVEFLARTVKDLLADTNQQGRLRHIIDARKTASLAFYVAFLENLTKRLFPEITQAFQEFIQTTDWNLIEEAVVKGYSNARKYTDIIKEIYKDGGEERSTTMQAEIDRRILEPLGI